MSEGEVCGPDGLTDTEREERWAAIEGSLASVRRSVVPLYGPRGKRVPYHGGCGVVVRLGTRFFVFTAAHVHLGLEENAAGEILVAGPSSFIPVKGLCYRTNSAPGMADYADAAVFEVQGEDMPAALAEIAHSVDRRNISARPDANSDIVTLGVPHRDATRTESDRVVPLSYMWEGPSLEPEAYPSVGLRPDVHVTMQLDLAAIVDDSGRMRRSLSPAGVSGSGMWRWTTLGSARLEGIFTDARDSCFIGTLVGAHLVLIRKYNPDAFAEFMAEQPGR